MKCSVSLINIKCRCFQRCNYEVILRMDEVVYIYIVVFAAGNLQRRGSGSTKPAIIVTNYFYKLEANLAPKIRK